MAASSASSRPHTPTRAHTHARASAPLLVSSCTPRRCSTASMVAAVACRHHRHLPVRSEEQGSAFWHGFKRCQALFSYQISPSSAVVSALVCYPGDLGSSPRRHIIFCCGLLFFFHVTLTPRPTRHTLLTHTLLHTHSLPPQHLLGLPVIDSGWPRPCPFVFAVFCFISVLFAILICSYLLI